jgi:hypothetical protein
MDAIGGGNYSRAIMYCNRITSADSGMTLLLPTQNAGCRNSAAWLGDAHSERSILILLQAYGIGLVLLVSLLQLFRDLHRREK